jgi:hypothetical protein
MRPQQQSTSDEMCIAIPLKNSQNMKPQPLSEDFVKVIEYEYAVKYLEIMGVEANVGNIQRLLRK